jgi:hypothetical protein
MNFDGPLLDCVIAFVRSRPRSGECIGDKPCVGEDGARRVLLAQFGALPLGSPGGAPELIGASRCSRAVALSPRRDRAGWPVDLAPGHSVVGLGDDARTAASRIWSRPGRPSAGVPAVLIRSVTTNTHLTSASCLSGRHLLEPARVTRHRAKASAGR